MILSTYSSSLPESFLVGFHFTDLFFQLFVMSNFRESDIISVCTHISCSHHIITDIQTGDCPASITDCIVCKHVQCVNM